MHSALLFHQGVWQLSAINDCFLADRELPNITNCPNEKGKR
jgi:hypothetical protein